MENDLQKLRVARPAADEAPTPPSFEDAHGVSAALADLLVLTELVPAEQLRQIAAAADPHRFAESIVDAGLSQRALAHRHGLRFVNAAALEIDQSAVEQVPFHILERAVALPYALEGGRLYVVVADPSDVQAIDELRLATRYPLELSVASRDDITLQLRQLSRAQEAWERAALAEDDVIVGTTEEEEDELAADDGVSDAPLVRLVNSVILQAAEDGASDLHFDPQADCFLIRQRIDGVLHEVQRLPRRLGPSMLTRLKVLAKLDIAERRKPQDGRISLSAKAAGRALDVRVAVLPLVEGEACVMRLLDKSKKPPTLEDVGFSSEMRSVVERLIDRPTGALLVSGPTGSGKSTTLYAALNEINRPDINIITVEDPVEYRLPVVNQVQINHKAGLTFALALRTILRSDPDVIMVGEVRDVETAKMAIESALTGHFVLSTLHTNDAPSVLSRLNEMGVEPFLTGSAVTAVLAQRLVRRLCVHCAETYQPLEHDLAIARVSKERVEEVMSQGLYRGVGCSRCNSTGFRGRTGIFQLMVMHEDLERLAASRSSRDELERAALAGGMKTLWDDGLSKATAGLTSIEELHRVLL